MNVFIAPSIEPEWNRAHDLIMFLAGAIDMGAAVDWQAYVIEGLQGANDLSILNPRREVFTPEMEVPQIEWELSALHRSDLIFLWLPKGAKAPISLLEFGMFVTGRKPHLLVGVEPGFYREMNVRMTCDYLHVACHDDLNEMIDKVKLLNSLGQRTRWG